MFKLILLMILIVLLLSFFGSSLVTYFGVIQNGLLTLVNAFVIPLDFFGRAFTSMFNHYYIVLIFSVFLTVSLVLVIVRFLRGVDMDLVEREEEEDESYLSYNRDESLTEESRHYNKNTSYRLKKGKIVSNSSRQLVSKESRYLVKPKYSKKQK